MTWHEVNLEQYLEIIEIQKRNDDKLFKTIDCIAVLKNINDNEININNYGTYLNEIAFLSTDIPMVELKEKYGNYILHKEIESITMKQYIDFQNYAKTDDYIGILSVFLIPENKEYNEDYDIEEVVNYIKTMSIVDVMSIYSFFLIYSTVSMECLKQSLQQQQQMILRKKKQERRKRMTTTAVCQLYWRLLKQRMKHIVKYYKWQLLKFFGYFRTLLKRMKEN